MADSEPVVLVQLRLSPRERAKLAALAAVRGVSMSQLVREMADRLDREEHSGRAAELVAAGAGSG